MLYMPYVSNYEKILKESNVDYTIINWDRFQIEDRSAYKYRDKKIGHKRNYYDYLKYKKFVLEKLNEIKYDKLIIFGLQLSYFLKAFLLKNHKGKYIIDIRDYNQIIKFFNIKKLIENSAFTVISSPGYRLWLPSCQNYIINHNTQINSIKELKPVIIKSKYKKISIACIGAIRDHDINIAFINSLKNNDNIKIYFHGQGDINKDITNHIIVNKINNVMLTGKYNKQDEIELYSKSDLINLLRYNDGINNRTALPNRLYNSPIYGKPILAYKGTLLSELVEKYKLGLVIDSFVGIEDKIYSYLNNFNKLEYEEGRISFLSEVIAINQLFVEKVKKFVNEQPTQ